MRIPIGRFSKMTRLSLKALRLYDQTGLLRPDYVDPSSGYRYYGFEQASRAEMIRILRSVDMPLDEIRVVVEAEDNEQIQAQLLLHKERLTSRLTDQKRMLTYLESIIEQKDRLMPYEVSVTEVEPKNVAAVRIKTSLATIANDVSAGFCTLVTGLQKAGVATAGWPMIVYHQVIDKESDGDIEICVPIDGEFPADAEVYGRELEGGTMATTLHRGPYERIAPAYHVLTGWVTENDRELSGPPREVYLNDPKTTLPEDLSTRLEFPIC